MSHLGNNAVGVASRASTVHVGGGVNGGGVGNDAVSIPSGTSTIVIGGNFLPLLIDAVNPNPHLKQLAVAVLEISKD